MFSCAGALLYFGCRARAEEMGFALLFDENALWIMAGTIVGEGLLILGGALLLAAILISASGTSKGSNAGTAIGTTFIVLSVIVFTVVLNAGDELGIPGDEANLALKVFTYSYLSGVAILFVGLVSGQCRNAIQKVNLPPKQIDEELSRLLMDDPSPVPPLPHVMNGPVSFSLSNETPSNSTVQRSAHRNRSLITASWVLIVLVCLMSMIPFFGFASWVIAAPILFIPLVMGIIVLSRDGTVAGLSILVTSLIAAPIFVAVAPVVSSVLGISGAALAISSSEGQPSQRHTASTVRSFLSPSRLDDGAAASNYLLPIPDATSGDEPSSFPSEPGSLDDVLSLIEIQDPSQNERADSRDTVGLTLAAVPENAARQAQLNKTQQTLSTNETELHLLKEQIEAAHQELESLKHVDNEGDGQAGQPQMVLKPPRPVFGITVRKCRESGIHIESVTPGGPATRCIDVDTMERLMVEPGDHIMSVNGIETETVEECPKLIASSDKVMSFTIKDQRSGKEK